MLRPHLRALIAVLFLCVIPVSGFTQGQQSDKEVQSNPIPGWSSQYNTIAEQLKDTELPDETLARRRDELDAIRSEVRNWISDQAPRVENIQNELSALGKPPGKGEEPEAVGVATQRQKLNADLADVNGQVKEAELIVGRTGNLIGEIWQMRRDRFARKILTRGTSPLSPSVWKRAFPELSWIAGAITRSTTSIVTSTEFQEKVRQSFLVLMAAIVFAIILVWPVHRWVLRKYGRDPAISRPSYIQAVRATLAVGAAWALLPTLAAALIYVVVISEEIITDAGKEIAQAVFLGIVLFTWSIAFFRASFSPRYPDWRLLPVSTNFVLGIRGVVVGLALAFTTDLILSAVISTYSARLAVTELSDFLLTLVVAALLLILLLRQHMWASETASPGKPRWRSIRILGASGICAVVVLGAFGYVALARLVVTQVVITTGLIFLVFMLHRLGRESIRQVTSVETWAGDALRGSFRMDQESAVRLDFWAGLAYDLLLVLFGTVVALYLWGMDQKDVADWAYRAFFGFKIGQVSFSLVDLFVAISLFVGFMIVARFLQRALAERILPHTQLDLGLRQSISTAFGYLGFIVAAVVGISAVGIDLSNLAIVAGALSVGIGFGLQNVVNNFVSGLVLLLERPVKVGDWVIVGDKEGFVTRIKVRATEIQTFDRASVFIPNSQLISDVVTNWTYADKLGRVIIPVGVAYGSDTAVVRDTLLEIAKSHPSVMAVPIPSAILRGFGDSALNFELRCFLQEIDQTVAVTSDLCLAIDAAFRARGIEIPFPQRDVHIRHVVPKNDAPVTEQPEPKAKARPKRPAADAS